MRILQISTQTWSNLILHQSTVGSEARRRSRQPSEADISDADQARQVPSAALNSCHPAGVLTTCVFQALGTKIWPKLGRAAWKNLVQKGKEHARRLHRPHRPWGRIPATHQRIVPRFVGGVLLRTQFVGYTPL